MQRAILTQFYGPTNARGSRVKASSYGVQAVWINFDGMADTEAAHRAAAHELCYRNDWPKDLAAGRLPNGDWAFVILTEKPNHAHPPLAQDPQPPHPV